MVATCTGFIEPLNLECILVNVFAGNIQIFTAIMFIAVVGLAARFRMPKSITLMMFVLFTIIFSDLFEAMYLLVVLSLGIFTFIGIGRLVKR
jgi:hypothetical protein